MKQLALILTLAPALACAQTSVSQPLVPRATLETDYAARLVDTGPVLGVKQAVLPPSQQGFSFAPGTWSGEGVLLFRGGWSACVGSVLVQYNITHVGRWQTPGLQSVVKGLAGMTFTGSASVFSAGYDLGLQYTEPAGRAGLGAGIAQVNALSQRPRYGGYFGGFLTIR